MMQRERRRLNPVWLVFVAPGLGRGWLLFHTTIGSTEDLSWLVLVVNTVLLLILSVLTWLLAVDLADAAGLWHRAKERFVVMATLSALAPPLSIAVAQTSHWGSFTLVEVISLWCLRVSFRLFSRERAQVISRKQWSVWVLSCLLIVPGLGLIGVMFAVSWPLESRFWLALSIPEWETAGILARLSLAQFWVMAVCLCGILLALGSVFLAFWWHHPLLLQLRTLVAVNWLFCGALGGAGTFMWIMHMAQDGNMYILQACALMIPICNAALFALPYMMTEPRIERFVWHGRGRQSSGLLAGKGVCHGSYEVILHGTFLVILSLYFCSQLSIYVVT
jgi:hypothetical protein